MMKRMHVLMLSALWLLCIQAWQGYAEAGVCLNKTAIVFSNGMFNDKRQARISKATLEIKVRTSPYSTPFLAEFEFYLAYADNGGAAGPLSLAGMGQLHEVFVQKKAASESMFWRWLDGVPGTPAWFSAKMQTLAKTVNAAAYVNDIDLQKQIKGDPANIRQQPGYRALLNQGMRVVIVAHSQGNFYANAAFDALKAQKRAWANSIGIVAVASPINRVADGRNRTLTAPEDLMINAVQSNFTLSPGTILANVLAGGPSWNVFSLGLTAWANASYGHSFADWYLAGATTRDSIIIKTLNTRIALKAAPLNMVAQVIMNGSRVASAPDGSVYITTGGGVVHLKMDGTQTPVFGVPYVEHVGPDGSLYYGVTVLVGPFSSMETSIFKVDPTGVKSVVISGVGGLNSFDVASDGGIYYSAGLKVYRIAPAGGVMHVAGGARTFASLSAAGRRTPLTGIPAFDWVVLHATHVKAGFNGRFYYGDATTHAFGGERVLLADLAGIVWHLPTSWWNIRGVRSWGDDYDVCPDGSVMESRAVREIWKYSYAAPPVFVGPGPGPGVRVFRYPEVHLEWSAKDDTIYFTDPTVGTVSKLVPSAF
ncbi:MAG: hypothetical protein R8K53_09325 [Mariprofundaceae bacterium]